MRKLTDVIASDLVGSRVDNQLPLLMAEGSKAGAVVTVANSEAIYAGNIEFHLGHELFDQPKASKEPFRANLLGLMGGETVLLRSDSVFMKSHAGRGKAEQEWTLGGSK
jgi:hypothetical protein